MSSFDVCFFYVFFKIFFAVLLEGVKGLIPRVIFYLPNLSEPEVN
jgi:hypothetical protein